MNLVILTVNDDKPVEVVYDLDIAYYDIMDMFFYNACVKKALYVSLSNAAFENGRLCRKGLLMSYLNWGEEPVIIM